MLCDVLSDPLFGRVSDRTTTRFGKRWVHVVFGALSLAAAIALWVLRLYGCVPNAEQSRHTPSRIRLIFGPVLLAFFALALSFLIWYPNTGTKLAGRRIGFGEEHDCMSPTTPWEQPRSRVSRLWCWRSSWVC